MCVMIVVIGKNSALFFKYLCPLLGIQELIALKYVLNYVHPNFLHGLSLNSDLKVVVLRLFG